jgi:hypothetical protein
LIFLAERFSLRDLPSFLALSFFGDLSDMAVLPCRE